MIDKPLEAFRIGHIVTDDEVKHASLVGIEYRRDMLQEQCGVGMHGHNGGKLFFREMGLLPQARLLG